MGRLVEIYYRLFPGSLISETLLGLFLLWDNIGIGSEKPLLSFIGTDNVFYSCVPVPVEMVLFSCTLFIFPQETLKSPTSDSVVALLPPHGHLQTAMQCRRGSTGCL